MNYAELTQQIYDYLQVQGEATFVSHIDQMIKLGEARIAREVDTPDAKTTAAGTLSATGASIQAPLDFISPLSLSISVHLAGNFSSLLLKDATFLGEAFGVTMLNGGGGGPFTGKPAYYSILSSLFDIGDFPPPVNYILVAPPADATYDYVLYYRKIPDSLVDGNGAPTYQTFASKYYPQVLLYACLAEGYTYLKGDKVIQDQYEKLLVSGLSEMRSAMAQQANDGFRPSPQAT